MEGETRTCKVCGATKAATEFRVRGTGKYLYRLRTCDTCHKAKERERREKYLATNREDHKRRARLDKQMRYEEDEEFRENAKASSRAYYEKNREKILARKRQKRAEAKAKAEAGV